MTVLLAFSLLEASLSRYSIASDNVQPNSLAFRDNFSQTR
ncbi:Uncharacterised protein [Vibrio cholerae]|nr:Uncharacterised protein [Vibrio cholerae]